MKRHLWKEPASRIVWRGDVSDGPHAGGLTAPLVSTNFHGGGCNGGSRTLDADDDHGNLDLIHHKPAAPLTRVGHRFLTLVFTVVSLLVG